MKQKNNEKKKTNWKKVAGTTAAIGAGVVGGGIAIKKGRAAYLARKFGKVIKPGSADWAKSQMAKPVMKQLAASKKHKLDGYRIVSETINEGIGSAIKAGFKKASNISQLRKAARLKKAKDLQWQKVVKGVGDAMDKTAKEVL